MTTLLEHDGRVDFDKRERRKIRSLMLLLRWMQTCDDDDRGHPMLERQRAGVLWLLEEVGAICGKLVEERYAAADLRCVRLPGHDGDCDGRIERPAERPAS